MMSVDLRGSLESYRGRHVLVTGNTGFKGSWLTRILLGAGARVTGYSLNRPRDVRLFDLAGLAGSPGLTQVTGDVRDLEHLEEVFTDARPEFVLHLAAQPIVRESYRDPAGTYATNVMGTVNVLEAARRAGCVRSLLNVTTDKVYRNEEWCWGYREGDALDGWDPYSNSKSCSELATASYARSFAGELGCPVSTARAGNVVGGGDLAPDRIVPDCVRALMGAVQSGDAEAEVTIRNPASVRPYQHVLEPLLAYLEIAARQEADPSLAGSYNVGPRDSDCLTTGELVMTLAREWDAARAGTGLPALAVRCLEPDPTAPHEAGLLRLDCARVRSTLGWEPRWDAAEALAQTARFTRAWLAGGDVPAEMDREIAAYVG